jgi:hypothetical protein
MSLHFAIASLGHRTLPDELASAADADVENVLLRAAVFLGYDADDVVIERVASVIPRSCVACTDVVASVRGTCMLVASPALY